MTPKEALEALTAALPYPHDMALLEPHKVLLDLVKEKILWLPPQPEGFGPWIEYKEGDPGPCINEIVHILTASERKSQKFYDFHDKQAGLWFWGIDGGGNDIVAYCVRQVTP